MRKSLREILKKVYRAIPWKQPVFEALRFKVRLPYSVYRFLSFKGVYDIKLGEGKSFLIQNDYPLDIEKDLFWNHVEDSWEASSLEIWIRLAKYASTILDIGANTGVYSLIAKCINPCAHVIALEPISRIHSRLVHNISINEFDIEALQIAASNYDGIGTMYDLPYEHVYAVMLDSNLHTEKAIETKVEVRKLSSLLVEKGIDRLDLLKIDVESHEPEVIEGIGDHYLSQQPAILFEIWNSEQGMRIQDILDVYGYVYFRLDAEGITREEFVRHDRESYVNYLACSEEAGNRFCPEAMQ